MHGFVTLFSVISAVIIVFQTDGIDMYRWLFLLPLLHGVILLFNYKSFHSSNMSWTKIIVLIGYTIRNVITPLFFVLGGFEYVGFHTIRVTSESDLVRAIILMSYETLVIFGGMAYFYTKIEGNAFIRAEYSDEGGDSVRRIPKGVTLYSVFITIIILLLIFAVIRVPGIRRTYKSMWTTDAVSLIANAEREGEYVVSGTVNKLLYSFFIMFFSLIQILVCAEVVYWFREHIRQKTFAIIASILVSGAIISSFVSESTIISIYLCIIVFIYIRDVFSEQKRQIDLVGGVGALAVILLLILAKVAFWNVDNENAFSTISSLLNAYFPGVFSISKTWYIETPDKFATFFTDVIDSFPLRSIIPNIFNGQRLVRYFNEAANTDFQIIPFITQVYYYFNFLGPFAELIFVYSSIKAENNLNRTDNYLQYIAYVTTIVLFGFGLTSRNITNILKLYWKNILPCLILAQCSNIRVTRNVANSDF